MGLWTSRDEGRRECSRAGESGTRKEDTRMNEQTTLSLDLEIDEIESREKAGGTCTSSTTSRHCTCLCFFPTTNAGELNS
jgi:hypothetical protein